ncbi:hypothetical protein ACLOJK_019178 [Asimina triloba]
MAESAVNFLIECMGPLLVDEVKLLKGVRGEARKIRDELESMRAFLRDADAKEHCNEGIKTWVRQEALHYMLGIRLVKRSLFHGYASFLPFF